MVVLQALLGALAPGTATASPMLDAFGNPLCITSMEEARGDAARHDHDALPECCTVACNTFATASAGDHSRHSLSNPLPASPASTTTAFDAVVVAFAPEQSPGSPRSPPLAV